MKSGQQQGTEQEAHGHRRRSRSKGLNAKAGQSRGVPWGHSGFLQRIGTLLAVLLLAGMAVLPAPALTSAPGGESEVSLHLKVGTFDPLSSSPPDVPDGLADFVSDDGTVYYTVQFDGPVQPAWRDALQMLGAEPIEYVPDFAYVVRLPESQVASLDRLPHVRWSGPWRSLYRLHPDLLAQVEAQEALDQEGSRAVSEVRLATYPGIDVDQYLARVRSLGAELLAVEAGTAGATLRLSATPEQVAGLARLPDTRWIEPFVPRRLLNERAQSSWLLGSVDVWNGLGIYGQGQVLGVADSGLDTGNTGTLHQDVRGRVDQAFALGRTGDWSDPNGHGTHVVGSVLGNGIRSGSMPASHAYGGSKAGSAPEARLVMQSVMDANGELSGIPLDLKSLFQQSYDAGARIHTNSWGAPVTGEYDLDSRNADQFNWDHKDMTILFAAGNGGVDDNADGVIDPDSLDSPGTAKNAITVGAGEGQRATTTDDIWRWYGYSVEPIRSDRVSDNHWGMAAFSSRGPTDDNRIKPDVVAPGSNISSLRSSQSGGSGDYVLSSGTSMATPLTAGITALIREWYQKVNGVANPSAALIKATLLNGAMRTDPGQYGTGSAREIPASWPNNVAGWGRVNAKHSISPSSPRTIWFNEHAGLDSGGNVTFRFEHRPATQAAEQLAAAAGGSLLLGVQVGSPDAEPGAPSVVILESSVPPGGIINVQATGFPANQDATVTLDGVGLGTLGGNAGGSWTFRVFLNTEIGRGTHAIGVSASGQSASDTFQVVGGKDGTFRVILAWTDYPGSLSASRQLVNDLNLSVTGPGGGTSAGNNTNDSRNNVEEVWLQGAGPGIYEVEVSAVNVAFGPQPFALVVSGDNLVPVNLGERLYLPLILRNYSGPGPASTATPTSSATPTSTATSTPTPTTTPTSTATPEPDWIVITQEDFEGAFPKDGWETTDGDGASNGEYYWAKRDCRASQGNYSAWAVGGGAQGSALACGSRYPNYADSEMVYGPFSLEGASDAELVFNLWVNTESDNDQVVWGASINNKEFYGELRAGTTNGEWEPQTFDLTNVDTLGDLRGEPQVWIGFSFQSDEDFPNFEGVYVDDIVLRKKVDGLATDRPAAGRSPGQCPNAADATLGDGFGLRCGTLRLER